jgi:hypothetical protein
MMEATHDRTQETASIIRLKGAFLVGSSQNVPHGRATSSTTQETKWESRRRRGDDDDEGIHVGDAYGVAFAFLIRFWRPALSLLSRFGWAPSFSLLKLPKFWRSRSPPVFKKPRTLKNRLPVFRKNRLNSIKFGENWPKSI